MNRCVPDPRHPFAYGPGRGSGTGREGLGPVRRTGLQTGERVKEVDRDTWREDERPRGGGTGFCVPRSTVQCTTGTPSPWLVEG